MGFYRTLCLNLIITISMVLVACGEEGVIGSSSKSSSSSFDPNLEVIENSKEALIISDGEDVLSIYKRGIIDNDQDQYAQICSLEVKYEGDVSNDELIINYNNEFSGDVTLQQVKLDEGSHFYTYITINKAGVYDFSVFIVNQGDTLINVEVGQSLLLTGITLESELEDQVPISSSSENSSSSSYDGGLILPGTYVESSWFVGDTAKVIEITFNEDGTYNRINKNIHVEEGSQNCIELYNISGEYVQIAEILTLTQTSMSLYPGCSTYGGPVESFTELLNYEVYFEVGKSYFDLYITEGDKWLEFQLQN